MLLNIIIGIFGLGIVVFFHEGGHFLAAKLFGIKVETFSIGWGKKLFSFRYGETEYRISMLPMGGFCKMKGEETLEENASEEDREGSLSAAPPWKKAIIYFAGPFMNLVFSVVALSIIWMGGMTVISPENRIILASEYSATGQTYAADRAGLKTGDFIVSVNGTEVTNFQELREKVSTKAKKNIHLGIIRDGKETELTMAPELDKSTGAGKIGVYPWIDPVIETVKEGSSAYIAGLQAGDTLTSVNGNRITNHMDLVSVLLTKPAKLALTYSRDGREYSTNMILDYGENGITDPGIAFRMNRYTTPGLGFFGAIQKGATESFRNLYNSAASLKLLFSGVDLNQAVSGPIRITYMMGEITSQGFSESFSAGVVNFLNFLSLINIALFVMNMLPIPALDGGQILFCIMEMIRGKRFRSGIAVKYQIIGFSILISLMIMTVFNDLIFLIKN